MSFYNYRNVVVVAQKNGNAAKKCKNCSMEFIRKRSVMEKERMEKLGETSPSYQRDLMIYRVSTCSLLKTILISVEFDI